MENTVSHIYKFFRPLAMLLPPEVAHKASHSVFKFAHSLPKKYLQDPVLKTKVMGLSFANPVGIAAGFDKDAKIVRTLFRAGFGFVEVGTLTPLPQKGNPKPRLFRLKQDQAIINRLGFNNRGMKSALKRLKNFPESKRAGPLGVNIGANKDSEDKIDDYVHGLEQFFNNADYITINISSPNTPGLRDLQAKKNLETLVKKLKKKWSALSKKHQKKGPPILIKIAPDMDVDHLKAIIFLAIEADIDGLIISNTTLDRPDSLKSSKSSQEGGLSGQPLFKKSTALLAKAYKLGGDHLTLIGVGGVSSGQQAYEKILAGASLVQLYSGLVYERPSLAKTVNRELADILRSNGYSSVSDAVGKGVKISNSKN